MNVGYLVEIWSEHAMEQVNALTGDWLVLALLPLPYIARSGIRALVQLYSLMIVVWAVMSWFDHSKGWAHDIYTALDTIVSPYISIFKRLIPTAGGVDFSPIIAILALQFVIWLLV
ncbi:MAG: YggT family protein [Coriobacteriales bacterium]|jgi:YggT family protein|nr:YggT family protein [Coriobacteriales bacterium]